ncbi:hypothetical protein [Neolewinella agarilytica]|uniref:hypothetical protein n=1 Tax=Neolewinella agarilytica TaxID=478744 RepID=UPI0023549E7A|nr:hypothetical protein [Neolewinella agarilytica]
MRLLLISLLFIGSLSLPAQAEEEGYGEEEEVTTTAPASSPMGNTLAKIATKLQLSDEQLPQVEAILREFQSTPKADSPQAKKARRRALRARISTVLTPEQQTLMRQNSRPSGTGNARPQTAAKRNWLDVLIDDIAAPLIDKRRRKGRQKN